MEQAIHQPTTGAGRSQVADLWILIVDDHPAIRGALRIVFAAAGIDQLDEVATAAEAIDFVRRHHVDVVLLDLSLPDARGLDALEQIKAIDAAMPVLVHTHHDDVSNMAESHELGAAGYVVKGVDTNNLLAAVQTAAAGGDAWTSEQLDAIRQAGSQPKTLVSAK